MSVLVMGDRRTNAEAIRDCFALGYLRADDLILDATYGLGRFWTLVPDVPIIAADLYVRGEARTGAPIHPWDFTDTGQHDRTYDAVVFDPPYKLNGTSTGKGAASCDESYGVHMPATWRERHDLIRSGITECARISRRTLLIKCQDQVCSGRKRWQTREFADHAEAQGFRLADQLHVSGFRPQPPGRRQVHAQQDYSTLLVLERA